MSFLDKVGYMAGVVPMADVKAQKRCYGYLEKARDQLTKQINDMEESSGSEEPQSQPGTPSEDPTAMLKNQRRQIESTINVLELSEGRYNWKKAKMFWQYWDKSKDTAISTVEGHLRSDKVYVLVKELEEGRFDTSKS